jgi:cytochrome c-type biogenesis protein CcmH/NrfG
MATTNLSLELVPIDEPKSTAPAQPQYIQDTSVVIEITPLGKAPVAPDVVADPAVKADPFMTEASFQYREGHLDQPLWDRAMTQANGDKETAVAVYLRARATALRLLDRERRSGKRSGEPKSARARLPETSDAKEGAPVAPVAHARRKAFATNRNAIIAGAALVVLAGAGWWLFAGGSDKPAATPAAGAAPVVAPKVVAPAAPASVAPSVPGRASPELMQKIEELRLAENWNVLVFYLVEWTRKEPTNAAAWDQLRSTYLTLRQTDDALNAAKKAVELAPDDVRMWRNLGAIYVDIDDSEKALRALEQVAMRDAADAENIKQIGILNAQLGRLPEAKVAFDQALTLVPGDAVALCMRAGVAQLSAAPKDAYATAKQAKVIGNTCRR